MSEAKRSEDRKETVGLELKDMGDAVEETKQTLPIPRVVDSAMGGWGVHGGWG
jgi:hypothetical protein